MALLAFAQPAFPLPAGIATISPPVDLTSSFPSANIDLGLDWLMYPWSNVHFPRLSKAWPPTDWKPCGDVVYSGVHLHPLVNLTCNNLYNRRYLLFLLRVSYPNARCYSLPLEITNIFKMRQVCQTKSWIHSHILVYFAVNHAKNGGIVKLQVYESMPHVFFLFEGHPCSKTGFSELVKFTNAATSSKLMETELQFVNGKGVVRDTPLRSDDYPVFYAKTEVGFHLSLF